MDLKTCFKCRLALPRSEFYRNKRMRDGLLGKCKKCNGADEKKLREKNRLRIRAAVRTDEARAKARAAAERRRLQDPSSYLEVRRRASEAYTARHPEKRRAVNIVSNAIRDGRLERRPCEVCGGRAQAHHDDYSRPLDVRWLCPRHHAEHHVRLREIQFLSQGAAR